MSDSPRRYRNFSDTTNSCFRNFWMTEKATSVRPEILSHLMLASAFDVSITRTCDACIHAARCVPVGLARKTVPTMTTELRHISADALVTRRELRRMTDLSRNQHSSRRQHPAVAPASKWLGQSRPSCSKFRVFGPGRRLSSRYRCLQA